MKPKIHAVFFDVGGTLVDETRQWEGWARWLDVPDASFFAALGAVIERRADTRDVFSFFGHQGIDPAAIRAKRMASGEPDEFSASDVYPDVGPCLRALRTSGIFVGIVGNQPAHRQTALEEMALPADFLGTSAAWGVEKPELRFFEKVVETSRLEPGQIAYVGDRLDNDVLPAMAIGMMGVFLPRGPWGSIQATWPEAKRADIQITALGALPGIVSEHNRSAQ